MIPREQAAFAASIETVRQMALTAAVTIEVRDDGLEVRQQAAAAALQGLAAGLRAAFLDSQAEPDPMRRAFAAIAADPSDSGTIECPTCKGRLSGLAPQKWRALFLKEEGSDGRPEADLYPRVSC